MFKKYQQDEVNPRSFAYRIKLTAIVIGMILLLGILGYAAILFGGKLVVNEADLILDATTTIETTDGEIIGELYNENRNPVPLEEVPKHVHNAFIAIEDRRFYEHKGIDLKSVVRAVYRNILAMGKVEGGSTITQQLAKNLFLYNDKTWTRKAKEAMAAVYLETRLAKEEILELYINEIYFGDGIYGIEKASNYFFSKNVSDLTVAEGAMLAGLAKAPNGYSPINHPEKALDRRNTVLRSMESTGVISTEERVQEEGKTLGLNIEERETNPWVDSYIDLVMKEAAQEHQLSINELKRGGYRIVVNMDEDAQKIAYQQFQNEAYFPGSTAGAEGAFVMMEQDTGKTIAAIGGRDYQLGDLNRVTVTRQPGSIMKPIAVYGPAMMQSEKYSPYAVIPDQQMDEYTVSNVDGQFAGAVTMFDAIKNSKNTSAVWMLDQIGVDYSKDYLEKMSIDIEDDGLEIALGGLTEGIAPLDLMESYGTFDRGGAFIDSYTIDQIFDQDSELIYQSSPQVEEVFSSQVAWNMTEMLQATVESGTAASGEYPKALAGKTGSTQHPLAEGEVKDAWFVGYTPNYTMATWMGYDVSDEDHYLKEGSAYPTSLTKAILTEMDKTEPLPEQFTKPDGVEKLPEPIKLPQITSLEGSLTFGGISLVKGKLSWQGTDDNRIVYRVYREKEGIDERVGEVEGETEFEIGTTDLFQSHRYYVVPYDPLTKLEGEKSNTVRLTG
ncbi:transglycosylase domain-containing protein [Virgibacillus ainsalahensis]